MAWGLTKVEPGKGPWLVIRVACVDRCELSGLGVSES